MENAFTAATAGKTDYSSLPWVIFTDPQVAWAGLDEVHRNTEHPLRCLKIRDGRRATGGAANDTRGFIKLIRHLETDRLLGAKGL